MWKVFDKNRKHYVPVSIKERVLLQYVDVGVRCEPSKMEYLVENKQLIATGHDAKIQLDMLEDDDESRKYFHLSAQNVFVAGMI